MALVILRQKAGMFAIRARTARIRPESMMDRFQKRHPLRQAAGRTAATAQDVPDTPQERGPLAYRLALTDDDFMCRQGIAPRPGCKLEC